MHHRDFSLDSVSGIRNKGKFLALTELGTTTSQGEKTGIDHLKELGVTHVHILPSYDEYLISYKDRTDVLNKEYQHKAFNSFGIFRPVILYNGQIVGNWNKVIQKQTTHIEMNWFKKNTKIKRELLSLAERKYLTFFSEL